MRTGLLHVISGVIGGACCALEWHRWCNHPATESKLLVTPFPEVAYACTQCGCEMELFPFTGRFHPKDDIKVCLRCGVVQVPD